ncbi:hypothetical protein QRD02_08590 [Aequorivita sp. SDUM287046]|uniref:Uncharacterized protein n=1 Tax=Aequorivita aurantiaca TaxID=3053356 RepID=A0ABT8DI34_9FLAO|nr:hypothetical protein [Aequorivita aurantiaca]MDN3724439.1 hypothetical protein [Aequorivita aurantiaca]
MHIGKPFNQLPKETYFELIENHKLYSDFNTLGLYRSLLENETLSMAERIEVRDFAHRFFQKTFDFLQLKDPDTFIKVSALGEELTEQEQRQRWQTVRENQQKILNGKQIKHRNFGAYSKHDCGLEYCPYNGMMVKQGSTLARSCMYFKSDENRNEKTNKAKRLKREGRNFKNNKNRFDG